MKLSRYYGWFFYLSLAGVGWLGYAPIVWGNSPGIYPWVILYSAVLRVPVALLTLGMMFLWSVFLIAAILGGVLLLLKRKRIYRQILLGILSLPLLLLALLPALFTCDPGASLTVDAWGQTYRSVYTTIAIDDNYGDGFVLQCDRSGILCHKIHKFPSDLASRNSMKWVYQAKGDQILLTNSSGQIKYRRSR